MKCLCPKASISNLQKLTISVLELLKIKNNLTEFKADGTISADFKVQTISKRFTLTAALKLTMQILRTKAYLLESTK